MSELVMEFQGSGNTGKSSKIELYADRIVIVRKRKGFLQNLGSPGSTAGDRTMFLDQITSVQVYQGGLLSGGFGFIRFFLPGTAAQGKYNAADALKDGNAVTFMGKKDAELANQFKEKIEELKLKASKTGTSQVQISSADEIKKYKQLLDDGILTEEEFNKKKKELLGL